MKLYLGFIRVTPYECCQVGTLKLKPKPERQRKLTRN